MKYEHFGSSPRWAALLGSLALLGGCVDYQETSLEGAEAAEDVGGVEQALTAADVFGFENLAHWTVSSGTKQSLSGGTQGTTALGVSNTYYSEIASAVINGVGFVSNDLALDVKLPSAAGWGTLQVVLEMPSKGIWYGDLGQKPLSAITAGSYQTVHFTVPSNVLTALQGNPSDLKVRIIFNGQAGATAVGFDNLRFVGQSATSVVEIRANSIDDVAYLSVNGLKHRIGYWGSPGQGSWVNVTNWFVGGVNDVRFFASNYGGPGGVDFEIRVDGVVISHVTCDGTTCPAPENKTFVNQAISLPSLTLPPGRQVQVTSPTPGKLYIDDEYTGRTTPTTVTLPSGTFRFGLGVSNDAPVGSTTGSFHEESVVVGSSNLSVVVGDTAAIGPTNVSKIAILPVRRARVVASNSVATLSNADVARFGSQVQATSDLYVQPLSYGLNRWEVTVLPIEEDLEISSPNFAEFPDHSCGDIVFQPKYAGIHDQYDTVVVHFSNTDANGVEIGRGDAGMAGRCGQVQEHWGRHLSATTPLPVVFHEVLHSYEAHHWDIERQWNGVSGLHGAEVHGYQSNGTNGEPEWTEWYRYFIRGQAAELTTMSGGDIRLTPPSTADYFVGVFRTARYGLWL